MLAERRSLDFSLAEVADRAGFSRGMPTHIFGSRDGMIRQLIPHLHVRSAALFGAPESRGAGRNAILQTASLLLDDSQPQADITIALHVFLAEAAAPQSVYRGEVRRLNDAATEFIWHHLEASVAAGEMAAPVSTRALAIILMAMMRGALLQWLVDPSVRVETLRKQLLASIGAILAA